MKRAGMRFSIIFTRKAHCMNASLNSRLQSIEQLHLDYLKQLEGLNSEQLNRQPVPGQWSAGQVMHHLLGVLNQTRAFMEKRIGEKKVSTPAGLKNSMRSFLLQVALALPIKYKAPRAAGPVPDTVQPNELRSGMTESLKLFRQLIESIPDEYAGKEIFKHPRIGYITPEQTLSFIEAHALHHKPQLDALLKGI